MADVMHDVTTPAFSGRGIRRRLVIAASLALVVVAAVASLFIVQGVDSQMRDVEANHEVRRLARDLIQAITDAETGQRGYLLTLEQAYLDPYREAVATMDATYRGLNELIVGDPEQRRRIAGLAEPIEQKRSEMATTIAMAMDGRVNEAMTILRSDAGRTLMEGIRQTLGAFIAQEDANLVERNAGVASLRIWLIAMIIVALGGAALLTYLLFARTQRVVSSLSRTQTELRSQKVELENRVLERTAELEEARAHAERERARVEALLQEANHRIGNCSPPSRRCSACRSGGPVPRRCAGRSRRRRTACRRSPRGTGACASAPTSRPPMPPSSWLPWWRTSRRRRRAGAGSRSRPMARR